MLVSFVMPAYKAQFLYDAIASVVAQTNPDWELVIVDDCSPEDLKSIVDMFDDGRIRYLRNESNLGRDNLVRQWNHSVSMANGEWIVLAADDDLYDSRFLDECLALIEKYPAVDLVRSRVLQVDEVGRPLWDDGTLSEYTNRYEYYHDWITGKAFTCIGNFMFRKSALLHNGGFIDFPCAFGSDIATPVALSVNGVANTQEMLFSFRQSAQHLSADASRFKEKLAAITKLSQWLRAVDFGEPDNERDREFYSVHDEKYLQAKCIYDYFNLVIRYVPLKSLQEYLNQCELASPRERFMMVFRWIKSRAFFYVYD